MSELGGFGIRKGGGGGTPITVPVSIANGGTNATSFTAPSGGVSPIPYFDGTRFVTDATPSHLGYDASTDTVYTGKIIISSSGTQTAKFINTATQSPTAGSGMEGFSDSGTAMVSGNRLGFYTLGGATNTSHTTNNSIAIEGFATENWNGTSAGAKLTFSTTANGGTTRGIALELGQDKSVKISNAWLLPTTAPTSGQVLGYVSSGVSGWVTPTSTNIYNSDGTLTSDRTLSGNTKYLNILNLSSFQTTINPLASTQTAYSIDVNPTNLNVGNTSRLWRVYDSNALIDRLGVNKQGSVVFNNTYYFPLIDGSSGQVLTTNGSGVVSWSTPTSPSGIWGISNSSGVYTYYATLTLAMAGATSGQTIELFTDVVESTNTEVTLKDGVDINFNGHSYTLSASGTASCFLVNYVGRNRFFNGKINRTGGTVNNANSLIILVNNSGSGSFSYLDFYGVEIYSSFGVGIAGTNTSSTPYINGASIRTFSHGAYYYTGVYANNCTISTFGGGNGVWAKTITNSYVETSVGGSAILFPYSGRASNCYAYVYGSGSGNAIYCQSGVVLTNCTAISTRNSAIYNFAATSYNCYAYSTAGAGFECGSNAGGEVYNSSAYSTAGSGILYAGVVSGCNVTSTSTYAIQGIIFGVKTNLYNSYVYATAQTSAVTVDDCMGNTIKCGWNSAGGHGVYCQANNTITNNTIVVTNASANALTAGASISLKYANNCFKGSTTPVNASITQSVTNTQDNQGNILL